MKKRTTLFAALAVVVSLSFPGCNLYRPTQEDFNDAVEAVLSMATISNMSSVLYSIKDSIDVQGFLTDNNTCPEITLEGEIGSRTITLSYADNCESAGISLSGEASGSWEYDEGSLEASLLLSDFQVQEMSADGTISLSAAFGGAQGVTLAIDADMEANGQSLILSGLSGALDLHGTPLNPDDDTYSLAGDGSFTNQDGSRYSVSIKDVTASFLCFVPTKGTMNLKSSSQLFTAKVDFGDGTCDSLITVTIGLQKQVIDLADWIYVLQ